MLKFEQNEIKFAADSFANLVKNKDNLDSLEEGHYKIFIEGIDDESYSNMVTVIENADKVNEDYGINKMFIDELYNSLAMGYWIDADQEVEQVRELVDIEEEYFTIYEKLLEVVRGEDIE